MPNNLITASLVHAAQQKFASNASEDRVAELEGLQQFLKEGIAAVDAAAKEMAAPADRIRELLSSKDKKATLLDLASASFSLESSTKAHPVHLQGPPWQSPPQGILYTGMSQHIVCHTKCAPLSKWTLRACIRVAHRNSSKTIHQHAKRFLRSL